MVFEYSGSVWFATILSAVILIVPFIDAWVSGQYYKGRR